MKRTLARQGRVLHYNAEADMAGTIDEQIDPENLNEASWAQLMARMEAGAAQLSLQEHDRLRALGIIDEAGKLLKVPAKAGRSGDGGGW